MYTATFPSKIFQASYCLQQNEKLERWSPPCNGPRRPRTRVRGTALLFFNLSTRWGGRSRPRHYCFTPSKETWYPLYRRQVGLRAGLNRCTKSHLPAGVWTAGRSAPSSSLYQLRYPAIYFFYRETALTCPKYITIECRMILFDYDLSNGAASQHTSWHKQCTDQEGLSKMFTVLHVLWTKRNSSQLFVSCIRKPFFFFGSLFHLHVHTFHFELHLCLPVPNHTPDLTLWRLNYFLNFSTPCI